MFYIASGIVQFAAGFVVDRLGARPVLLGGMALLALGTLAASLAPNPWWLFPCAAIMGAGNGVFHPSDFAILNANVDGAAARPRVFDARRRRKSRLSRSRRSSASGSAPRSAGASRIAAMGVCGLIVLGVLASQRSILTSQRAADAHLHTLRGSVGLFVQPAILLCFFYFVFQTAAAVGLADVPAVGAQRRTRVPLVVATSAVTAICWAALPASSSAGFSPCARRGTIASPRPACCSVRRCSR